jgi:hypothetical protein
MLPAARSSATGYYFFCSILQVIPKSSNKSFVVFDLDPAGKTAFIIRECRLGVAATIARVRKRSAKKCLIARGFRLRKLQSIQVF